MQRVFLTRTVLLLGRLCRYWSYTALLNLELGAIGKAIAVWIPQGQDRGVGVGALGRTAAVASAASDGVSDTLYHRSLLYQPERTA